MRIGTADGLTLSRVFLTPVALLLLNQSQKSIKLIGMILFIIIGITDFLDGYYARISNTESKLGAILDPLADKWFMLTSLFFLSVNGVIASWNQLIVYMVLLREIFVLELRGLSIEKGKSIQSSKIAKIKTFVLILGLSFLVFDFALNVDKLGRVGMALLWIGNFLSISSVLSYFKLFSKDA